MIDAATTAALDEDSDLLDQAIDAGGSAVTATRNWLGQEVNQEPAIAKAAKKAAAKAKAAAYTRAPVVPPVPVAKAKGMAAPPQHQQRDQLKKGTLSPKL